ncbi:hypothetical protein VPH35_076535 [Triticum aestivum]|uniref:Reverse transcriptase zinc-binding domain-containing protein n=1 Tax=Aegilops tauschii subsp. strangulata TaxID=200361 RepID=A0A453H814_AEGTS
MVDKSLMWINDLQNLTYQLDSDRKRFILRSLLFLIKFGRTNSWRHRYNHLLGDFLGERFLQVREQVNSLNTSRCGNTEDEMHMFFLCPFSKAAWFCSPWFIKTEILAAVNHFIPIMIQTLLNSGHPQINPSNLYTFLWCLWKSRNDALFARKFCRPSQVYAAANAIIQGTKLGEIPAEAHAMHCLQDQLVQPTIQNPHSFSGNTIFCDAAWEIHPAHTPKQAGIGVFIQV